MAKDSIADLNIAIRATADKLSSDINRGMKGAQQSSSIGAIALGTAIGVSVVAGLGAAMAGVKKVVGMAFEGLDRIDALDEAASKIGITYNALQDLKLAAVTTGASFEGMVSALAKMQGNMANGSANEALQKLGLSAEYLRQLAPEKQFAEISQKLSEIKNTGDKIDLTKSIFGKGGVEILNVINGGKEGMAEIARTAELFGGHLTDAQRSMATMAQGEIEKLKEGWGYIKDQIAVAIGPALIVITQSISKFVEQSGGLTPLINGWADAIVEFAAGTADAFSGVSKIYTVAKALASLTPWGTGPVDAFKNAVEAADALMGKNLTNTESYGDAIRKRYQELRVAIDQAAAASNAAADEKKQHDKDVANNFGDTTDEMTRAYEGQMEANRIATEKFQKELNSVWDGIPGRVKASLEGVISEYTGASDSLSKILKDWAEKMIQSFVTVSGLMSISIDAHNSSDWWNRANAFLQSLAGKKELDAADAQRTIDSMRTNKVELSPAEAAMAKSTASREASQAREAARVSANRAESATKSAARKEGIGGGMKIGSFDGSFTAPSMNGQAPSFFGGGGMKTPRMNTAAAGGTLGPVTINQSFSSGVTRAELAGSMDDLKDATLGAVLNAVSNGGGFRNALQA